MALDNSSGSFDDIAQVPAGKKRRNNHNNKNPAEKNLWVPNFPYTVDYNDHFETPLVAYQDIAPLLDWLGNNSFNLRRGNGTNHNVNDDNKKTREPGRNDHMLYDPYYCNGQTKRLFQQLGFSNIIHHKRDFYADISANSIPHHDTLVTNPPYSDQHKEQCLDFCFSQLRTHNRPFFLLMPNYVAAREYFRKRLDDNVVFLVPPLPYEYSHPEGTGKDVPPFASLWFCGVGKENVQRVKEFWDHHLDWLAYSDNMPRKKPVLVTSLEELKHLSAVPTEKRPNPRQRKKRRQHAQQKQQSSISLESTNHKKQRTLTTLDPKSQVTPVQASAHNSSSKNDKKKSKYRDVQGQRQKKRF